MASSTLEGTQPSALQKCLEMKMAMAVGACHGEVIAEQSTKTAGVCRACTINEHHVPQCAVCHSQLVLVL